MIINFLKKISDRLSPKPKQALDAGINWNTNNSNVITNEGDTRVEYTITAISHSVSSPENYALVLEEKAGKVRLPVVIGGFEAQAIAVAMEHMTPKMPLTHDLMKVLVETTGHTLTEVSIDRLTDGVFGANLIMTDGEKRNKIRCRVSDAVAIALRFDAPIYVYQKIVDVAGIIPDA